MRLHDLRNVHQERITYGIVITAEVAAPALVGSPPALKLRTDLGYSLVLGASEVEKIISAVAKESAE